MDHQRGENKFTGAKNESINDYSQNSRMATSKKNDHDQKNDKKQQGGPLTVPATATSKNDKDRQGRQQQPTCTPYSKIPLSSPHGKPPPTNAGRLIQPKNLLKMLTANVQSLSQKNDELISLIQFENIDVIALNETRLDTQK